MAVVSKWAFTAVFAYVWGKLFRDMSEAEAKALGAASALKVVGKPKDVDEELITQAKDLAKEITGGDSFSASGVKVRWRGKGGKTVVTVGKEAGTPELFNKYCKKELGSSWSKALKLAHDYQGYEPDYKSILKSWGPIGKLERRAGTKGGVDLDKVAKIDPYGQEWQRKKRTKEEEALYQKEKGKTSSVNNFASLYKKAVINLNPHGAEKDISEDVRIWENLDTQEQESLVEKLKLLSPTRRIDELEELLDRRDDASSETLEEFFEDESELVLAQVAEELETEQLAEFLSYPLPYDVMALASIRLLTEAPEDQEEVTDERAIKFLEAVLEEGEKEIDSFKATARLERHYNKENERLEYAYLADMGKPRVLRWLGTKKPSPKKYYEIWKSISMFKNM